MTPFGRFVPRLESDLATLCSTERDTQDSSEYGRVVVPAHCVSSGTEPSSEPQCDLSDTPSAKEQAQQALYEAITDQAKHLTQCKGQGNAAEALKRLAEAYAWIANPGKLPH
ncbi:hypothetical protein OH809_01995 [Streptomyces sp. NBC_00873]|uniref:hypothetical protein n=1 Tax=unclassified Streptomyces TaxID=2593676 RepID=UPI003863B9D5|nr:hypothetical protein OH809_01995 [Streptomyces sp. NBC_00873]WTA48292.1 hypothetical protein OH821_41815 [Streptomyces sp. NBC_00842]